MQELHLIKSPNPKKKWRIEFPDSTHVDFGASGYQDYTQHNDLKRKDAYISRHRSREDLDSGRGTYSWLLVEMGIMEPTNNRRLQKRHKQKIQRRTFIVYFKVGFDCVG